MSSSALGSGLYLAFSEILLKRTLDHVILLFQILEFFNVNNNNKNSLISTGLIKNLSPIV